MKNSIRILAMIVLAFALIYSASAAASFAANAFSCTPSEVVVNDVFSCTAQIKNTGDASGSVSIATLYPDSNGWLEGSNYPQASGTSVDAGQSTEVTFSGLRAVKSGSGNGFLKIMLDSVTDNGATVTGADVNTINIVNSVSNSVSSAAMGESFVSTSTVTAGGNVDVILTFSVDSGDCVISGQSPSKTISGMQNGNQQQRTWTVTMGTSGDCKYTVSAAATGSGGVASKTDSSPSSVTCTDCSTVAPGGSSGGGGGGGGGGGSGSSQVAYIVGVLNSAYIKEIAKGEKIVFNMTDGEHSITLTSVSGSGATVEIQSEKQTLNLAIGETASIDLNADGIKDVSVNLKSVNASANKATILLAPLASPLTPKENGNGSGGAVNEGIKALKGLPWSVILWIVLIAVVVLIVLYIIWRLIKKRGENEYVHAIKLKSFKNQ